MTGTGDSKALRLVTASAAAQRESSGWTQERADEVVAAAAWAVFRPDVALELAELAHHETGLGDPRHLYELLRRRVLGTLDDMDGELSVGVVSHDSVRGLVKIAKPVGVVAVAAPATAPCSSVAANALAVLKTRNAAVFTANPRAARSTATTIEAMRVALQEVGANPDLLQVLPAATRSEVAQLMEAADLVVAVGGQGTVRRAYSSGTPAIGSGVGNPVVIVDETASVTDAARLVALGASYNNGTSCSSESTMLVHQAVEPVFMQHLRAAGAHQCSPDEADALADALWTDNGELRREAVGRSATELAARAGFPVPQSTTLLVMRGCLPLGDLLRTQEKLSPVCLLLPYTDWTSAVDAAESILVHQGLGHSCGIYTKDESRVLALAERLKVARVLVNQSTAVGNSGAFDNGLPFTATIASGTWGGCSHSENITWRHLLNTTTVSRPLAPRHADETALFRSHWQRHGH